MQILAVDDEPSTILPLKASFERQGHSVVTASDGQSAFDALKKNPVQVLITDWSMPMIEGPDLVRVRLNGHPLLLGAPGRAHAASGDHRNHLFHRLDARLLLAGENEIVVERQLVSDDPEALKLTRLALVRLEAWR